MLPCAASFLREEKCVFKIHKDLVPESIHQLQVSSSDLRSKSQKCHYMQVLEVYKPDPIFRLGLLSKKMDLWELRLQSI